MTKTCLMGGAAAAEAACAVSTDRTSKKAMTTRRTFPPKLARKGSKSSYPLGGTRQTVVARLVLPCRLLGVPRDSARVERPAARHGPVDAELAGHALVVMLEPAADRDRGAAGVDVRRRAEGPVLDLHHGRELAGRGTGPVAAARADHVVPLEALDLRRSALGEARGDLDSGVVHAVRGRPEVGAPERGRQCWERKHGDQADDERDRVLLLHRPIIAAGRTHWQVLMNRQRASEPWRTSGRVLPLASLTRARNVSRALPRACRSLPRPALVSAIKTRVRLFAGTCAPAVPISDRPKRSLSFAVHASEHLMTAFTPLFSAPATVWPCATPRTTDGGI